MQYLKNLIKMTKQILLGRKNMEAEAILYFKNISQSDCLDQ